MGPRPCGRGRRRLWEISNPIIDDGFNGATALRPWTATCGSVRPWPAIMASMGPRPCGRGRQWTGMPLARRAGFNGATALRPWTAVPSTNGTTRRRCFNGATALRPWTAGGGAGMSSTCARFNGATALRPWTADYDDFSGEPADLLQWGHGLAAVDGQARRRRRRPQQRASMGPRPCGRGRDVRRRLANARPHASMGPRPCGRGRPGGRSSGRLRERASMGPRPCGRGRGGGGAGRPAGRRLQWGHGLAAVDGRAGARTTAQSAGFNGATALRPWTGGQRRSPRRTRLASMGPRPCGRGRVRGVHCVLPCGVLASMGPRPCGRGRGGTLAQVETGLGLQWGHGLAAVDGADRRGATIEYPWGFNGATALRPWTAPRRSGFAVRPRASMGPRPCGRGRQIESLDKFTDVGTGLQWGHGLAAVDGWVSRSRAASSSQLQWGHGLAAVDGRHGPRAAGGHQASMGPRPCGRGRYWRRAASSSGAWLQWGHGLAAVDGPGARADIKNAVKLQWGHGLAAVDGCRAPGRARGLQMLQWGHGLAAVDGGTGCT